MKKLSLILSIALFTSAAVFAGDDKKDKKTEACTKEKSCCANKKTAKKEAKSADNQESAKTEQQSIRSERVLKASSNDLLTAPATIDKATLETAR